MVYCAAWNCTSSSAKKARPISFFAFPLKSGQEALLNKWLQAISREGFHPTTHSRLCSDHFTEDCFVEDKYQKYLGVKDPAPKRRYIKILPDAVPTVFAHRPLTCTAGTVATAGKADRLERRKMKKVGLLLKQSDGTTTTVGKSSAKKHIAPSERDQHESAKATKHSEPSREQHQGPTASSTATSGSLGAEEVLQATASKKKTNGRRSLSAVLSRLTHMSSKTPTQRKRLAVISYSTPKRTRLDDPYSVSTGHKTIATQTEISGPIAPVSSSPSPPCQRSDPDSEMSDVKPWGSTCSSPETLDVKPWESTCSSPETLDVQPWETTCSSPETLDVKPFESTSSSPENLDVKPWESTCSSQETLDVKPFESTSNSPDDLDVKPLEIQLLTACDQQTRLDC